MLSKKDIESGNNHKGNGTKGTQELSKHMKNLKKSMGKVSILIGTPLVPL